MYWLLGSPAGLGHKKGFGIEKKSPPHLTLNLFQFIGRYQCSTPTLCESALSYLPFLQFKPSLTFCYCFLFGVYEIFSRYDNLAKVIAHLLIRLSFCFILMFNVFSIYYSKGSSSVKSNKFVMNTV